MVDDATRTDELDPDEPDLDEDEESRPVVVLNPTLEVVQAGIRATLDTSQESDFVSFPVR